MDDDLNSRLAEFRKRIARGEHIDYSELEDLHQNLTLSTKNFSSHRSSNIQSIPPTDPLPLLNFLGFLIGIALTVWACISYRPFDPSVTLFSQPHWWLLLAIYLLNPRALAVYYVICAQPSVAHWPQSLILGCLLIPGGWGAYLLPGLSKPYMTRVIWGVIGSLVFDVLIRPALQYRTIAWTTEAKRATGQESVKQRRYPALVYGGVLLAIIGWAWIIAVQNVAEETRETVAHEAGYESYARMKEYLTAPCLHFWNGVAMQESKYGYMTSENLVPLRAIASRPNVCLFETYETVNSSGVTGVIGTMKVWYPYFVFERRDNGVMVGESLRTPEANRRWTPIGLCFCWTTRECLSLERKLPTYRNLDDAKLEKNGKLYLYRFTDHFIKDPSKKDVATYRMAALPVIDRVDKIYWRVAKPEGDAGGYETCWIKWDGKSNAVVLRFRTTRQEYSRYINGLWNLRTNIREKEGELLGKAVDWVTAADLSDHSDHSTTKKRLEGVPLIGGFWLKPPENIEEFKALKKRLDTALRIDSSEDLWDCTDTAYLTPDLVY